MRTAPAPAAVIENGKLYLRKFHTAELSRQRYRSVGWRGVGSGGGVGERVMSTAIWAATVEFTAFRGIALLFHCFPPLGVLSSGNEVT